MDGRTASLTRLNLHDQATAQLMDLAKQEITESGTAFQLARVNAILAAGVHKNSSLSPTEQSEWSEHYAGEALRFLKMAREMGYFEIAGNTALLSIESDFDVIRSRPGFSELVGAPEP